MIYTYTIINPENRNLVNAFLMEHWFSTDMVLRGSVIDMTRVEGIFLMGDSGIEALITYEMRGEVCEILSLDSLIENRGTGTKLTDMVIDIAKAKGCKKVVLITTNDNIRAIGFYQKRGFDMVKIYHNALNESRKLKPEIPLIGLDGIPLMHEIEFEMELE